MTQHIPKGQPRLIKPELHNHFQYSHIEMIKANLQGQENILKNIKQAYKGQEDSENYQQQVEAAEENMTQLRINLKTAMEQYEAAIKEIKRIIKEADGDPVHYIDTKNNQLLVYNYSLENGEVISTLTNP